MKIYLYTGLFRSNTLLVLIALYQFIKMTKLYGELALNKELNTKMKSYEAKFGMSW
jgi:ATP:corrinoid adenosyltransferase